VLSGSFQASVKMSKRQNQTGDDESTGSANNCITPGNASTTENLSESCGLKNTLHGNVFQLKLLILFLIRGINAGYQFRLGTEIPGMGGKFDDLIFKFKKTSSNEEQIESYRFLQAKHKQNEETEKITAADLLNDNNGEFSLPKYFRSYFRDIIQGSKGCLAENVHDCIICTNIGFNPADKEYTKSGIELIRLDDPDKILTFDKISDKKISARYKLKKTDKLRRMMAGWSEVHLLAKTLLEYVDENKKLTINLAIFKSYHVALVNENVIDRERGKLCTTFLEGDSRFREILSEITFVYYWTKLSFKYESKKKIRVDSSKKLIQFEGITIGKLLPKYSTTMGLDFSIFEDYNGDLISENIIDAEWRTTVKKPFTKDFVKGINLTQEGSKFRKKLCDTVFNHYWKDLTIQVSGTFGRKQSINFSENKSLNDFVTDKEINGFLDKLVFVIHTPNEVELDGIIKREVGDYYELHENDFQSDFILRNMLDWFKKKESKFMTSEEGKNIFKQGKKKMKSLRLTAISIDYQKQLKEALEFNDEAIGEMKMKLMQLLTSPNRIGRIATQLPKRTAVKVIAALEKFKSEETITNKLPKEYFQFDDSYLVTSSSRLQKDLLKFKKVLKSEHSHNVLIVVCEGGSSMETDEFYQKLVKKMQNKRVIIINQGGAEVEDKLKFGDLSENSQRILLEKEIEFQGSVQSVGDLIKRCDTTLDDLIENGDPDEVIDCYSIEELLMTRDQISIRTCSSGRFEPLLYVDRQLEFPLNNIFFTQLANKSIRNTEDELQGDYFVDSKGNIEWFVQGNRKKEIWEKMKNILHEKMRNSPSSNDDAIPEEDLIKKENRKGRVIIITGIAGTGKTTILSNYYEKIKQENPNIWVIRIDLVYYRKELTEFNFSPVHPSTAIEFFVNLFAKKSSFARSLLTHRFQTDGRIVVMLDGFDEIGNKLHEKVFQLITAIRLTNCDALYITSRLHFKKELQDKLFQFAYTFKNFSKENQVDCLVKYWENKLKMPSVLDGPIQSFSKSLVDQLTTTLKDREREFIGIPLQCRMLAECFETQLQDTIQQGLPIDSLIQNILKNDFDLTSLYSLLMKKKLEIYREEKFKADPYNHQADWVIENTMRNLISYLRKLSIKTIVIYPKYVDVLLDQSSFQSKEEISQEEEDCTGGGVYFGFLDKNDKGEFKFLHRTYAEYLFAKYLHGGFLPAKDKNCNKLLTSEPVREIIFRKILIKEQYEGVRVFFNAMLKENVQPMAHLSREIEKSRGILGSAIRDENTKIFEFMCDCLDMSLSKVDIRLILSSYEIVPDYNKIFYDSQYRIFVQNSKLFERFISYYDKDTNQEEVIRILGEMLHQPLTDQGLSERNQEEIKRIMELVLSFLHRSRETPRIISGRKFKNPVIEILKFFICNEYYGSLLKTYLELLSSAFIKNELFEKFLSYIFIVHRKDISHENLEKTLQILRDLERNEVLNGISRQIFQMNTELFKKFYRPKEEASIAAECLFPITDIQSLLVRDEYEMTRLHRAVLYADEKAVDRILEMVRISCLSHDTESKLRASEILNNVIASGKDGFTPLYVAATCESETICQQMLIFLKEMLTENGLRQYLTEVNGFLCHALWNAMEWEKVQMVRMILKSVKETLGQDYLIALMKAQIPEEELGYSCCSNMLSECDNKILFDTVVEVIVDNETKGYEHLNDLLFFKNRKLPQLQHIESRIFQRMLPVNRLWIKQLFDIDLKEGFDLMFCYLLEKLTVEQRFQIFHTIISDVNFGGQSYWDQWFDEVIIKHGDFRVDNGHRLKKIFKGISANLGQSAIQELLRRNNYELIKRALLLCKCEYNVHSMLTFTSNPSKDEIIKHLLDTMPHLIHEITETSDGKPIKRSSIHNIINFAFDYVDHFNLSNLVDLISNTYINADSPERKRSIWTDYLDITRNEMTVEKISEKIDKFLKCVWNQLGQNAVEKLVVEHEGGQVITQAMTCRILSRAPADKNLDPLKALFRYLSKEKREEIELKLVKEAPATIKHLIDTNPNKAEIYWRNILHMQCVVKYADSVLLLELIEIIRQSYKEYADSETETSIWRSYLMNSDYDQDLSNQNIDNFLQFVSKKLTDKSKVKELVLHNCDYYGVSFSAIGRAASQRKKSLVEVMLAHLTEEDRDEIRRDHVDTAVEMDEAKIYHDYIISMGADEIYEKSRVEEENLSDYSDEMIG
jgi:hypothetical protein